jgi:mono/diheme cytochrome c family protein
VRLLAGAVLLAGFGSTGMPGQNDARFFDRRVAPILERRCLGCHNEELKNAGISFTDRASLLKGGPRGPAVVPGDPERSMLIRSLRGDGAPQMPPGPQLSRKNIATLTEWVRRGAPWGRKLAPATR